MTTIEIVEYLTSHYPGFTSIETETDSREFWESGLKITARRGDFTKCGIVPHGNTTQIKSWLNRFIYEFDRDYTGSRPSGVYLSSSYKTDKPSDDLVAYVLNDIKNTERLYKEMPSYFNRYSNSINKNSIKDVIFNDPATIVFWTDGSKTVVKCQNNDTFDPEVGLAMAIAKKALGNKGNYCNTIKKWTDKYYEKQKQEK